MFLAVCAGPQSRAWTYHTVTKLRKMCHGQQPTGGWKNETKYNIIIRHKVLGKHIPVPKTLLAFHKLATAEVLQNFVFSPKEDTKCDRYPEQSQTSANCKWESKLYCWSSETNVFSSLLNMKVIAVQGFWQKAATPWNLLIPLDSSSASNSCQGNVFPMSRRKRSLSPSTKALKKQSLS